ncbi:urease accessory protein UreE [Pseudodonghicola flavimaris]|uniref:Urease accessory protein UreE n=1 Tax=Pseudodonghicola flavimaris TaxID=3050036 RepID=A0ABT7F213_9RHOB|nr:urease accessory protein UreE [Pseudodonghicola flavimaris]MDK3018545.1 urease accessory protein UreE [Pseudodonghicola flavimaris]
MTTDLPRLEISTILGSAHDDLHDAVHALEHRGRVEWIDIPQADAARKRLRATTDKRRDCLIALPRSATLVDGAVLHMTDDLAVVLRVDSGARLVLVPHDLQSALRLGHWCGNLHWKVDFGPGSMTVLLDGPEERYRERLRDLETLAGFHIREESAEEAEA